MKVYVIVERNNLAEYQTATAVFSSRQLAERYDDFMADAWKILEFEVDSPSEMKRLKNV